MERLHLETISPKILEKVSSDPAFHKKWGLLLNFRFATAPFLFVCVKDRVRALAPLFSSNHQSLLRAIIGAFPDLISGYAICSISPAQNFIEFFVFFC